MRVGPSATLLASASSWGTRVSSWLGSTLLAADVPILSGRATGHVSQRIQKHVSFTVPPSTVEAGRTVSWLPDMPAAALARYGQVIDVTIQAGGVDCRVGRYLITDWSEESDGSITIDADGLQRAVDDDRLLTATGPRDDGTLKSELRRMLPAYTAVAFDGMTDRAVPKAMEWAENRLDNAYEIADAWPGRLREDEWGQLRVAPPLPLVPSPVLTLRDGPGGTLMSAPISDTRTGGYNVFVARSSAQGVDAQAVVQVQSGPMDPAGPYRPVPKFLASPLLGSVAECEAAALTMRDTAVRESRIRKVTIAPDPRPDLDDAVEIITGYGTAQQSRDWGYVVGYDIGLTVGDGPTRLDVTV